MYLSVRGLEEDRESRIVDRARPGEEGAKRIVLRRKLLASEEEQRHVVRAGLLGREVSRELDRHSDAALHVARAQPVYRTVLDTPRNVRLGGDGVVVPCEHDERRAGAALREEEKGFVVGVHRFQLRRHEREEVLPDLGLIETLGRDVHELERPLGETVGERAHARSVPRHNPSVTPRQPDRAPGAEPERGFVVGCLPEGGRRRVRARRVA